MASWTKVTNYRRWGVFFRDKFRCRKCKVQAIVLIHSINSNGTPRFSTVIPNDPRQKFPILEIDHILPRCRGGGNDPKNLRTLCWYCNNRKGGTVQ